MAAPTSHHVFSVMAFAFTLFWLKVVISYDHHQIMAMAASTPAGTLADDYTGYGGYNDYGSYKDISSTPAHTGIVSSGSFPDADSEGNNGNTIIASNPPDNDDRNNDLSYETDNNDVSNETDRQIMSSNTINNDNNNTNDLTSNAMASSGSADSNSLSLDSINNNQSSGLLSSTVMDNDKVNNHPKADTDNISGESEVNHYEKHTRRSLLSRRSLLPSGTAVKDKVAELQSHVVVIRSRSNGVGTGLLVKKNFVLTAKRLVMSYVDPYEFTIQLQDQFSNGFEVFVHPHQDLAVIKIHPPIEGTGRVPSPNSPKGFFWPVAIKDPNPNSTIKVYGYGTGSFGYYTGRPRLNYKNYKTVNKTSKNHITIQTKTVIATTTGDVGGPAFVSNGTLLAGIVTPTRKPRHGALISLALQREWIFDAMKTTCNKEQQAFTRLLVGEERDVLVSYHCKVDRAEQIRLYMVSKPACKSNWKSVVITGSNDEVFARLETNAGNSTMSLKLTKKDLETSNVFYIQLWKAKLPEAHTLMATHGPFDVEDFIDGGVHFDWCEA